MQMDSSLLLLAAGAFYLYKQRQSSMEELPGPVKPSALEAQAMRGMPRDANINEIDYNKAVNRHGPCTSMTPDAQAPVMVQQQKVEDQKTQFEAGPPAFQMKPGVLLEKGISF